MGMIRKLNYIFDKREKIAILCNVLLALVAGAFELLGISAFLPLINLLMDESIIYNNQMYYSVFTFLQLQKPIDFAVVMALVLIFLYIAKNAFLSVRFIYQNDFSYRNRKKMAIRLLDSYLHEDYLFHVVHGVPELQRNIDKDVTTFMSVITSIISILVEMFTCSFMLIFLFITDAVTTILILSFLSLIFSSVVLITRKRQVQVGANARSSSAELNKWLMQSLGGIKEIKVFGREGLFLSNYSKAYDRAISANKLFNIYTYIPKYIIETLMIGGLLVTIIIRLLSGVGIKEFAVTLSAIALVAVRVLPALNRMTEYIGNILYGKPSIESIYNDLNQMKGINDEVSSEATISFTKEIAVDNLFFRYPESNKFVLRDVTFSIKKYDSVAIIGESGAGKSTIVDLLLGLLKPNSGEICVDGANIKQNYRGWRSKVGYIPQFIYLFDDTIRMNVAFGTDDVSDEKVWTALKNAQLDEFVKGLDDGLDTVIGERGVKLSGGQRQRLGIARALYSEPEILFMDEATSSLDTETENSVMEAIEYLHGKTTLVIVAHRMTTIQNCDCIYKVENESVIKCNKEEVLA